MNRVAKLSPAERNELFALTAERRGFGSVAVVEKDFWVCWTLKRLFEHPELSRPLIFLGTGLSLPAGEGNDRDQPCWRKVNILPGETQRKRIRIPILDMVV
ncbi:MAG TPA: hypothetical protein VJ904_09935 [Tichowtungia sp.]|nr:hypothetical protein [Tichowtungia sp.]